MHHFRRFLFTRAAPHPYHCTNDSDSSFCRKDKPRSCRASRQTALYLKAQTSPSETQFTTHTKAFRNNYPMSIYKKNHPKSKNALFCLIFCLFFYRLFIFIAFCRKFFLVNTVRLRSKTVDMPMCTVEDRQSASNGFD